MKWVFHLRRSTKRHGAPHWERWRRTNLEGSQHMVSKLFKYGGGAGIGSYVIVIKDGQLAEGTDYLAIRSAYDSGDTIYLSIHDDETAEALLPLTGYVDFNNELHLIGRDFDDNQTYEISVTGKKVECVVEPGITLGSGNIDDIVEALEHKANLVNGKIPTDELPDDYTKCIFEYPSVAEFPDSGESGKLYIALDTNVVYRWDGADYVAISGGSGEKNHALLPGYYFGDVFWKEAAHINRQPDTISSIYLDIPTNELYYYNSDNQKYTKFVQRAVADDGNAGLVKLYGSTGENVDGTMTQKSITDQLKKKVQVDMSEADQECIIFETNIA